MSWENSKIKRETAMFFAVLLEACKLCQEGPLILFFVFHQFTEK